MSVQDAAPIIAYCPWRCDDLSRLLRPEHIQAADGEGTAKHRPVAFHKAEHSAHGHALADAVSGEQLADPVDLLADAIDELGAVPPADHELLNPGEKMPPLMLSWARPV
jgi:hypothetical protein